MEIVRIRTENPRGEQWRLLGQFAYPASIHRYRTQQGVAALDDDTALYIVGCIRQAQAYFTSGESAPLDISPLLVYYGATVLLSAVYALQTGHIPPTESHGMEFRLTANSTRIADHHVIPSSSQSGALTVFSTAFSPGFHLAGGIPWTVGEILGSLPDLKQEFENCYVGDTSYTIPVKIVKASNRIVELVSPSSIVGWPTPNAAFAAVVDFAKAYTEPQSDGANGNIILNYRVGGREIGTFSMFGQKYLQVAHAKPNTLSDPNQIILFFMGLFALGFLSRYYPRQWNPFVVTDDTGEKLVIESFITLCCRYFPNLVLNSLYDRRYLFVYETE